MKTGIEIIAEERARQLAAEGWTPEHDDAHFSGQLIAAATCYATVTFWQVTADDPVESFTALHVSSLSAFSQGWPFEESWWKPSECPVRNLAKAGALIAAEIDRLNRLPKD